MNQFEIVPLGDIITIKKGKKLPEISIDSDHSGKVRYLQIDDLRPNSKIKFTSACKGTRVESNDLIIAWDGANAGTVGYGLEGFIGSTLARLRFAVADVDTCFIGRFLQSKFKYIQDKCTGATIPHVSRNILEELLIPLPPFSEQQRIAAILDKADAVRRKRQESIRLTEEFLRSVFLDMFGDPVTNPKGWDVQSLEECCLEKAGIKAGPFGSALKKEFYTSSGYRIYGQEQVLGGSLGIGDYYIDRMKYASLKSCAVAKGDLLISLVGSIGQTLVVPEVFEPGIINPRLIRIRTDSEVLSTVYLQYVLKQECIKKMLAQKSHGGTMPVLNASMLKQLEFPIPPVGLQNKFIDIMERSTRTISQIEVAFLTSANLFNSLVQRAFKGTVK